MPHLNNFKNSTDLHVSNIKFGGQNRRLADIVLEKLGKIVFIEVVRSNGIL